MVHLDDLANRFHSLSVTGICQPHYETRVGTCKLSKGIFPQLYSRHSEKQDTCTRVESGFLISDHKLSMLSQYLFQVKSGGNLFVM